MDLAVTKRFDLDKFLAEQVGQDLVSIFHNATAQAKMAEDFRPGKNNPYKRDIEIVREDYMYAMKSLCYFLQVRIKPGSITREVFLKFKPVIVSLVERKQFPAETLDLFGE